MNFAADHFTHSLVQLRCYCLLSLLGTAATSYCSLETHRRFANVSAQLSHFAGERHAAITKSPGHVGNITPGVTSLKEGTTLCRKYLSRRVVLVKRSTYCSDGVWSCPAAAPDKGSPIFAPLAYIRNEIAV